MIRSLLVFLLILSTQVFAAFDTPVITHSKLFPRTLLRTGYWGYLEVVGNFDKIVDNRVVQEGRFEYRIGEGNWTVINGNPAGNRVWSVSWTANWRRIDFSDMTGSSLDLRVCLEGTCSLPYIVYFAPRFLRVISPENATITPYKRNLRFSLIHHRLGGMKFYIGKLDPYPGSPEIYYSGKEEIDPGASCPQVSPLDTLACEITIPDSIMENPGRYALTATTSLGTSINFLEFNVVGGYKVVQVTPVKIESAIQDLITIQVADEDLTTRAVYATMASPCPGQPLQVMGAGRDKLLLRLPPECIPTSGCGDIQLDLFTPGGVERVKIPYEI